jgi:hypothetical protein
VIFFDCDFFEIFLKNIFFLQIFKGLFSIQFLRGKKMSLKVSKKITVKENRQRVSGSKFESATSIGLRPPEN